MADEVATQIAVIKNKVENIESDITEIKKDIRQIKDDLPKYYVSKTKFEPFEKIFWLGMGLLITTVGGAIISLVLPR